MQLLKLAVILGAAVAVAGCEPIGPDKSRDRGTDDSDLSRMRPGIWVDPVGCHHWIIDDGVEGYLTSRLDPYGKPVCPDIGTPTYVIGDFKQGATVLMGDPM